MIAMVIRDIQKSMGDRAAAELFGVFTVCQKRIDICKPSGLDADPCLLLNISFYPALSIDFPDPLGDSIRRRSDNKSVIWFRDGSDRRILQFPGKEIIKTLPVRRILIHVAFQVKIRVCKSCPVIRIVPGLL